jgi:hypothetical protein
VISVPLARRLRDAGLRWEPARGDAFVVVDRGIDDEVFVLSDMTIEVHEFPTGPEIGFNGTVEWALDSVEKGNTLWLPREDQLRELLGGAFVRLERSGRRHRIELDVAGRSVTVEADAPADAYGLALLHLATGEAPAVEGGGEAQTSPAASSAAAGRAHPPPPR